MRQALGPGALGRPRGIGCRGRWEGGLGCGTHVCFISMYDKIHYNKIIKNKKDYLVQGKQTLKHSLIIKKGF